MALAVTLIGAVVLALLAVAGLSLGALLGKRTPLRGSCRGRECETGGDGGAAAAGGDGHSGCRCAGEIERK
jgi:hypothetical protein